MKELHTGAYYWNTFEIKQKEWPSLQQSLRTKVVIVGGGMSGLLTAYMLHEHGIDFVLVEANEIAEGSSLASTGLLQYCNDIMLSDLRSAIGQEKADTFYRYCYRALDQLKSIAAKLKNEVGDAHFRARTSLQYCTTKDDIVKLEQEYNALASLDFPCELWGSEQIEQHFPFSKGSGLITHGDAEVNPHLFVLSLAQYLSEQGCHLYERSIISDHTELPNHRYSVTVNDTHVVEADYIVYAVGYQPEQLKQSLFDPILNRSYVIVTNPVADLSQWYEKYMLWETARPYLYLRTTVDSRIIVGGLDETIQTPNHDPASIEQHNQKLLEEVRKLFPHFDLSIEYYWNATFGETEDQLPYLGVDPKDPHIMYILGYGGNGTVSSMLGAELIMNLISGSTAMNDLADIVKLDR